MVGVGVFICLLVAVTAIVVALTYKPKPPKSRRLTHEQMIADRRRLLGKPTTKNRPKTKTYQRPNTETHQPAKNTILIASFGTLTGLVNGQRDVARRLIEGNLKKYPDKSPDWACEKAIADIERDRRI